LSEKARHCGAFARVLERTRLSGASMWDHQGRILRPVWWAVFPISGIPLRASTRPVHFATRPVRKLVRRAKPRGK